MHSTSSTPCCMLSACRRSKARANRRTACAALIVAALSGATLVGVMAYGHLRLFSEQSRGVRPSPTLRLPFTIPCAVDSDDAGPIYGAFQKRDRELLRKLFTDKKFVAVPKGMDVRIANFGAVSMIIVDTHPPRRPGVCFVPAYVIPVIREHASG